jgi:hypothetical protein
MAKMIQVPYDYTVSVPVATAQAVQKNHEISISLQALGLLVNLLSYPSTWELHKTELYKRFAKDGEKSVRSAWNDLEKANYIIEFKYRVGKKYEYVYYFRKVPFTAEEKAEILASAEKEYGEIWGLRFGESNLETPKRRDNINTLLNKKTLLKEEEEKEKKPIMVGAEHTELIQTEIKMEEEKTSSSQSELIFYLLSKNITLENALVFEKALLEAAITGYTYEDILNAIERSLRDFNNEKCNEPYKWAVGKLKRMLDGKTKEVERKPKRNTRKGRSKVTRTEMLPDWFYEDDQKQQMNGSTNDGDLKAKKRALEEKLKKYKKAK